MAENGGCDASDVEECQEKGCEGLGQQSDLVSVGLEVGVWDAVSTALGFDGHTVV